MTTDKGWWGSRNPFLSLIFSNPSQPAPTGSPPSRSFPTEEIAFVLEVQVWLQEARPLESYCLVLPSWQLALDSWAPRLPGRPVLSLPVAGNLRAPPEQLVIQLGLGSCPLGHEGVNFFSNAKSPRII